MAKIFISYSRDSQDIVEELVQDLNDDDHETWFDQRLSGGQKWWDSILSEIRQSDIFVAALTPDSLESQACLRELNYAQRLQKRVLPIRLSDKVKPEALAHGLAELQNLVYRPQDKAAFKVLQKTIRKLPEAPPLPDPLPDPPSVPMSYLSTLREQIEIEAQLTPKDQSYLVSELRSHFRDGGRAEEIIDLLHRLKRRNELLAKVQRDIDDLLGVINQRPPPPPPPPVPSSGLSTLRDQIGKKSPFAINDQFQLVFELRRCFLDGSPAKEILDLLELLKKRDELLAEVSREIDKLQTDINRKLGTHSITTQEFGEDPVPNLGREIKLDSAAAECRRIMERVLNKDEVWELEIDLTNRFIVKLDASAAMQCIMVTASLVDTIGGAKAAELKKLGWTVDPNYLIKAGVAGAALYLTGGLAAGALLSKAVRDTLKELEANRSWSVTSPKDAVIDAAADLTLALRGVAPEANTIIVRRKEAETQA